MAARALPRSGSVSRSRGASTCTPARSTCSPSTSRSRSSRSRSRACRGDTLRVRILYGELAVMALVFAVVGFYQYETRTIFENAKLNQSNVYEALFRVNSVFYDPSIYGRFLVVALMATAVLIVRGLSVRASSPRSPSAPSCGSGCSSRSRSRASRRCFVAVFALAAIVWRWKSLLALAAVLVVAAGIAVTQPNLVHALRHHSISTTQQGNERASEPDRGGDQDRQAAPVARRRSRRLRACVLEADAQAPRQSASHNTPVTVAAEGGALGLLLFFWLVVALFMAAFRRIRHPRVRHVGPGDRTRAAWRSSCIRSRTTTSSRIRRRGG